MTARILVAFLIFFSFNATGQTPVYQWQAKANKISEKNYEVVFTSRGDSAWQLYAPGQVFSDVPVADLSFEYPGLTVTSPLKDSGRSVTIQSPLFEEQVKLLEGPVTWRTSIAFADTVPSLLRDTLTFSYGKDMEFYTESFIFSVELEGGAKAENRIRIASIDIKNPVVNCGDDEAGDKSLLAIFFLGFVGGLIALVTPCVFPLIPLTVSFFTKRAASRVKGIRNAMLYGLCIFVIYAFLSTPFHLLDNTNPEILNNISTNVVLNLVFFAVFIVFALSFFGLYEIGLPSSFANKVDSKSGIGDFAGIFYMALTLAIVSFSCTGPILGSLLAGALTNDGGAWQLTSGMAGFGLGLALPFALFALFPGWLQTLPRSGGWLTNVKVVLGFLELAMAVKFLSNADLVKQWHILPREVFIGIWIVIGICIVLYLLGKIRFPHDSKPVMSSSRIAFIVLFSALTIYLLPGVTNTKWANLKWISGFPPPLCYSVYKNPVNCESGMEPIHNDYEKALQMARAEDKPVLIDFTGWACVNCRRMEEKVWVDPVVRDLMMNEFIVVSLYVDERTKLPAAQQMEYVTKNGDKKSIITVGDKWATFQFENFNAVQQPQYAIIGTDEVALTRTKGYTDDAEEFSEWLKCGIEAFKNRTAKTPQ